MKDRYAAYRKSDVPWLQELPKHWPTQTGRRAVRPIRRDAHPEDGVVTAFRDGEVTLRSNRRTAGFTEAFAEHGYQGVRCGDLVIHGMDGFAGAIGVSQADGKMTPVVHLYSVDEGDARYFAYLLRTAAQVGYIQSLARGIRERSTAFDRSTFAAMLLPVPTSSEQRYIADYLDRETARIDELIAKQERLIEVLRERRRTVLNSSFARIEMRSAQTRLGFVTAVTDCDHTTPEVVDEDQGYEAVRTGSVRDGAYRPDNSLKVSYATWRERISVAEPELGDVLFTREAPAGEACMVPAPRRVCLGQRMVLLKPRRTRILGEYLMWHLYTQRTQDYFRLSTNGSTVGNIRLGLLRATPISLPSLEDQQELVLRLAGELLNIDRLIDKAGALIDLAQERRSALITAAVTGQIDVRGVV